MKTIILRQNNKDYFLSYINGPVNIYKGNTKNIIFRILYRYSIFFLCLFFDEWKKNLDDTNNVIIFDSMYNKSVTKYIKRKNKNIKIIFYYWNKINANNKIVLKDKQIDEIYTFNYEDSVKYDVKFNPQFYTLNIPLRNQNICYDVVFIGMEKNRGSIIKKIEKKFKSLNISTKFLVISNKEDFINYNDYLNLVYSSKCILDIGVDSESGLTLRSLEALFFEKKLITNYLNIVNYDFYNKNNVFIIGIDNMENLKKFIEQPVSKIPKSIKSKYDFESWKKRFELKEN